MEPVIIVASAIALILLVVVIYDFGKTFLARRRFLASVTRPKLDCLPATQFQAAFKEIMARGEVPYLVVACHEPGVVLPRARITGRTITLNISFQAVNGLRWENQSLVFRTRFEGKDETVRVPIKSVVALYSAKTGHGVVFRESWIEQSVVFDA